MAETAAEQRGEEGQAARPAPHRQGLHHRASRCATSWPSRRSTRSSRWRTGRTACSSTTSPRRCPSSRIRIKGNVQELLLDAYRRIDEGELLKTRRPWSTTRYASAARSKASAATRSRPSTSRPTSACGGAWERSSTTTTSGCRTRSSLYKSRETAQKPTLEIGARLRRLIDVRGARAQTRSAAGSLRSAARRAPIWGRRTFDRFLADLIDAIPEGIYVTNDQREVVYWSEGAEQHHGLLRRRRRRQPLLRRHPGPRRRLRPQAVHRLLSARGVHRRRAAAQRQRGLPQARRRRTARRLRQDPALRHRRQHLRRRGLRRARNGRRS